MTLPDQKRIAKQDAIRKAKTPTWKDLKAEGVIDHIPEPDSEGKVNVQVRGPEANRKLMKMLKERYRADVEYYDSLQKPKKPFRDRHGRERWVEEAKLERAMEKHGTTRRTFRVPRLPFEREPASPGRHTYVVRDGELVEQ